MPLRLFRRRRPERDPSPDASALPVLVRRLELRARRLMENRAVGAYDSVFRGHGVEFSEVRAYQPGDPFQAIDWKVTARMGKPFIKKFVEERELTVLLAVDLSGSTDFGTRVRTKRDLSLELAALLGLAAARNNDRVGLLLFTDRVERWLAPRRGRGRLRQLLHVMASHRPEGRGTDIGLALATAVRSLKTRSLVFVLSDFQGPEFRKELTARLAQTRRGGTAPRRSGRALIASRRADRGAGSRDRGVRRAGPGRFAHAARSGPAGRGAGAGGRGPVPARGCRSAPARDRSLLRGGAGGVLRRARPGKAPLMPAPARIGASLALLFAALAGPVAADHRPAKPGVTRRRAAEDGGGSVAGHREGWRSVHARVVDRGTPGGRGRVPTARHPDSGARAASSGGRGVGRSGRRSVARTVPAGSLEGRDLEHPRGADRLAGNAEISVEPPPVHVTSVSARRVGGSASPRRAAGPEAGTRLSVVASPAAAGPAASVVAPAAPPPVRGRGGAGVDRSGRGGPGGPRPAQARSRAGRGGSRGLLRRAGRSSPTVSRRSSRLASGSSGARVRGRDGRGREVGRGGGGPALAAGPGRAGEVRARRVAETAALDDADACLAWLEADEAEAA